jgi:23S rRNA (cytosine1962-C5)-methyltransferase
MTKRIILRPGKEKTVIRRHPWIFSGAIASTIGDIANGEAVEVYSSGGEFLAWGQFSTNSQIRARVISWTQNLPVDEDLYKILIRNALEYRKSLGLWEKDHSRQAVRLVNAESDLIPGVVIDLYDDVLVGQFLTAGADKMKHEIVKIISEQTGVEKFYERSDVDVRRLEGLTETKGWLLGEGSGVADVLENDILYQVDYINGHKTGFYLDQKDSRQILRGLTKDKTVLNCFCYTGGFSLAAALGGAKEVVSVDSSADALEIAKKNSQLNDIDEKKMTWVEADVFLQLRKYRDENKRFDLIILDPPKFAANMSQMIRAERGYKDINMLAMKLLAPGGILLTFSCSGIISMEHFKKITAWAALDALVSAKIFKQLQESSDHPVLLSFPEGEYLKGLAIRVNG